MFKSRSDLPDLAADQREAGQRTWIQEPNPKSSHSPFPVGFFSAGERPLSRPRRILARRREVLTGAAPPHTIAVRGMGADPRRSGAVSGSCWSLLRIGCSCLAVVCLSPRFYPHCFGPAGPLLDGVPRLGGALLSRRRSRWTRDAERSPPHIDGCASLRCQSVAPFPHATMGSHSRFSFLFLIYIYAAFWLFRSGSYTSPVTHNRCKSTDNFRATAITARFLAFLAPHSQIRRPYRRRSLSLPKGPRM